MTYTEFKKSQSEQISNFPVKFAFSNSQFDEVVSELGPPEELLNIGGGGFIRKINRYAFDDLFDSMEKDKQEFLADDDNLQNAIEYELRNHEYGYTCNDSETIDALNLDMSDDRVLRILTAAKKNYLSNSDF